MLPKSSSRLETFFKFTALLLAGIYLVNCFSPLRLHVDTLRYYAIKDCIEFGCPPDSEAARDYLPYGYTGLMLFLSKLGILRSFTIIFINCLYLFLSLYFILKIFQKSIQPFLFMTLVLLNWTTIKFVAHPLSEMQYLFFSVLCLYFFFRFTQTKRFILLLPVLLFCAAAFLTRTVGITLVGAIGLGLLWEYRQQIILLIRKNRIIVGILVVLAAAVLIFSKQLGLTHYTGVFSKQFDEGLGVGTMFEWHFTEWFEITANTSAVKVAGYLPGSTGTAIFVTLGVIFFLCFLYLLLIRKNSIPFIVKAYLVIYFLLMFNWPFYDPRFWVPIIPFMIAVILHSGFASRIGKTLSQAYAVVYALAGLAAIAFFTYTSLDKKTFVEKQANGVYKNEYEVHFYGKPASDTAKKVDPVIVNVLKRYD